jgi:hypothetical protein
MKDFAIDYYALVTVASLGVFQLAAIHGGLRGLLVFRSPLVTRLVGFGLPLAAALWFFASEDRNVSDHLGGLSSNEIALTFFLGTVTAWTITAALSSIVNARTLGGGGPAAVGLESLRDKTYLRALSLSLRHWSGKWRAQMKRYSSG